MHYILLYDVVPDYVERRGEFRDAHLAHAKAAFAVSFPSRDVNCFRDTQAVP